MGATFRVDPMGVVEDNSRGRPRRLVRGCTTATPQSVRPTTRRKASTPATPEPSGGRRGRRTGGRRTGSNLILPNNPVINLFDRHEWRAVAIAAAAILVVCSSLVFVIALLSNNGPAPGPTITVLPPTAAPLPPPVVLAPTTVTQTVLPRTALPTQRPVPTYTYPDPDSQLRQYADEDYPVNPTTGRRIANFDGPWVPQLSSKHGAQPWTYDKEDGVTYTPN